MLFQVSGLEFPGVFHRFTLALIHPLALRSLFLFIALVSSLLFSPPIIFSQTPGTSGELWFRNDYSADPIDINISSVGNYRWDKSSSNYARTYSLTGTNTFYVPYGATWSVAAVWDYADIESNKVGFHIYKINLESHWIKIDFRTTGMAGSGDLLIYKDSGGDYRWDNTGNSAYDGKKITFGQIYRAWNLFNKPLQTSSFDQNVATPTNLSMSFQSVGGGYVVPKLSWSSPDNVAEFEVERQLGSSGSWITIKTVTSKSYTDYTVRIHPDPNMNTQTASYKIKALLRQQSPPDGYFPLVESNYSNSVSTNYWLLLKPALTQGAQDGSTALPQKLTLAPNYPNPFAEFTKIPFAVPERADIAITVFDILGRPVRKLYGGDLKPGEYLIGWDGKNDHGATVASGTYFILLQNQASRVTRKVQFIDKK